MAITAGLLHSSVRSVAVISLENDAKAMERLRQTCSASGRYQIYREALSGFLDSGKPCVPHLGVHLTDALSALERLRQGIGMRDIEALAGIVRTLERAASAGAASSINARSLPRTQACTPAIVHALKPYSAMDKKTADARLRARAAAIKNK